MVLSLQRQAEDTPLLWKIVHYFSRGFKKPENTSSISTFIYRSPCNRVQLKICCFVKLNFSIVSKSTSHWQLRELEFLLKLWGYVFHYLLFCNVSQTVANLRCLPIGNDAQFYIAVFRCKKRRLELSDCTLRLNLHGIKHQYQVPGLRQKHSQASNHRCTTLEKNWSISYFLLRCHWRTWHHALPTTWIIIILFASEYKEIGTSLVIAIINSGHHNSFRTSSDLHI